jgi:hypothetical protein
MVTTDGHVGLYFTADERPSLEGTLHAFRACTFASQGQFANRLRLLCCGLREADETHRRQDEQLVLWNARQNAPRDWHEVAVEVTPEKIIVFWEGQPVHEVVRTREVVSITQLAKTFHGELNILPPRAFTPRGALGLFVDHSTAQFRNIVVRPQ